MHFKQNIFSFLAASISWYLVRRYGKLYSKLQKLDLYNIVLLLWLKASFAFMCLHIILCLLFPTEMTLNNHSMDIKCQC